MFSSFKIKYLFPSENIQNSFIGMMAINFTWMPTIEQLNSTLSLLLTALGIVGAAPIAYRVLRGLFDGEKA
jgi:hypothetical protein